MARTWRSTSSTRTAAVSSGRRRAASSSTSSCRCGCDGHTSCREETSPLIPTALLELRVQDFRCIGAAELAFVPSVNLFSGGNGAGKTSFLEAIYLLGRGRSFRCPDQKLLIRTGAGAAWVAGRIRQVTVELALGVRIEPAGFTVHVGGQGGGSRADLAREFPVQAIDADIGELVQGPPDPRRRLLDWGVFHVEQAFLESWRRFRRSLGQRNAVLRDNGPDNLLAIWEAEIQDAGEAVDASRQAYIQQLRPLFEALGTRLLDASVRLQYQRGWPDDQGLAEALHAARSGDRKAGYTRLGPHRADLAIQMDDQRSRGRASKGQLKLLGCALALAQCAALQDVSGQPAILVVDEPSADLDPSRLEALLGYIIRSGSQVFMASIEPRLPGLPPGARVFHVEHGCAKALL